MKKSCILIIFFTFFTLISNAQQSKLFDIARKGTVSEIKKLYKKDTKVLESKNSNGFTPLILACYNSNTDVAKFIISKTKDINYKSEMGTALTACIVKGNEDLSKTLLENKANPNLTGEDGKTALIYAVQFQNIELVKLLLKYDADKTLKDKENKTAFEYAAFTGNEIITNLLK